MKHLKIYCFLLGLAWVVSSCKKLVEVAPPITSMNTGNVFNSDITATAVLTGIYAKMSDNGIRNGITAMSLYPELSSDNLALSSDVIDPTFKAYYQNALSSTNTGAADFWQNIYSVVYAANAAIEGLTRSTSLTPFVKDQLLGEAKFIRAFCYLHLVSLYGAVPLAIESDYRITRLLPRTDTADIYAQIITDLNDAKSLLSNGYMDGYNQVSTERTTPNKAAATALLARAFLYMGDYVHAKENANAVINEPNYDTVPLSETFLKNSKEAIWQLQPVGDFITNTTDAHLFFLPPEGPNPFDNPVYLTPDLINSFQSEDLRKRIWIDSVVVGTNIFYFPAKYKAKDYFSPVTEYTMILRLSEIYLIRAEAEAKTGDLSAAIDDLNVIRAKAGLPSLSGLSTDEFLASLVIERRHELFAEWGHRWLDLKRFGLCDQILGNIKGTSWQSTDQLYPIPQNDIDKNPALKGHQNPGY